MDENELTAKFKRLVETVDVAGVLTVPLTRSIEDLLTVSAASINAAEASVLIRDGGEGDLRFLTVVGTVAEQLQNVVVPAGKGIAGFVVSSGQPMIVTDVGEEDSFYAEIDKQTGYSTEMILATPLRFNDEVIGVLEYINRTDEMTNVPFSPEDMDKAAMFAEALSSLVNAYESAKLFRDLGQHIVDSDDEDFEAVREWLSDLRDAEEHRELMELAVLVREIAGRGEAERKLCLDILKSIAGFTNDRSEVSFLGF